MNNSFWLDCRWTRISTENSLWKLCERCACVWTGLAQPIITTIVSNTLISIVEIHLKKAPIIYIHNYHVEHFITRNFLLYIRGPNKHLYDKRPNLFEAVCHWAHCRSTLYRQTNFKPRQLINLQKHPKIYSCNAGQFNGEFQMALIVMNGQQWTSTDWNNTDESSIPTNGRTKEKKRTLYINQKER